MTITIDNIVAARDFIALSATDEETRRLLGATSISQEERTMIVRFQRIRRAFFAHGLFDEAQRDGIPRALLAWRWEVAEGQELREATRAEVACMVGERLVPLLNTFLGRGFAPVKGVS